MTKHDRQEVPKKKTPGRHAKPNAKSASRFGRGTLTALALLVVGVALVAGFFLNTRSRASSKRYVPRPAGTLTFCKDIAPIVFTHCSNCHRPGQSGPFDLLTYAQVKKHARDISTVTQSRYMPPWPPEPGRAEFVGQRLLTVDQLGLIHQWVAEGALEGSPADLPAMPKWTDGWQLGEPDLVVQMPQPFTLPASGKDVYRNFVIPIPNTARRYVHAVELRPGNKSVHHAFMLYDRTRHSRRLDRLDGETGFPGMSPPVSANPPTGQFVTWQPGKTVLKGAEDSIWTLEPNTDLVLQMHLQPTGKPEQIQASAGFYFTDTPPPHILSKISFSVYTLDIPAGATDYIASDSYVLPVDVEILGVLPHAHYLGKEVQGFAILPDGSKQSLLLIKHWDFNWQGDYQFRQPIAVPKGGTLTMHWTFDNSTNNVRNPQNPPTRVLYGVNTTNEMAELSFRVRLRNTNELALLDANLFPKTLKDIIEVNTWRLRQDPNDAKGHAHLGQALMCTADRKEEALKHLQTAIQLEPDFDEPHYSLGLMLRDRNQLPAARKEFETVLRLNPEHSAAHGNLGFILAAQGELDYSEEQLRAALQLNPEDTLVQSGLAELLQARSKMRK